MQGETELNEDRLPVLVFQSTLPMQGETHTPCILPALCGHFNPLSLCRERLLGSAAAIGPQHFNPLSLCRERRITNGDGLWSSPFQSTLPIQGETPSSQGCQHQVPISIHSPYTGRDIILSYIVWLLKHFNPLSLYRERLEKIGNRQGTVIFQSTLPIQGETVSVC